MNANPARAERIVTLVSALGAAQGVAIVTQISATGDAVGVSPLGGGPTAQLVLAVLSTVFLTVAITVASVVVTGAAEVLLTGQVRDIALRRLLGASAREERTRAARTIMRRAGVGMIWGSIAGYVVSLIVLAAGLSTSDHLHLTGSALVPSPLLVIALGAQLLVTWTAAQRGTKSVLEVQPIEALRMSADADSAVSTTLAAPPRASAATLAAGLMLLGLALLLSVHSPLAMLPAVAGGVLSFVGIVSYAHRFVPHLLAAISRILPRTLAMTLARRSLMRHPLRTSRAVLGVAATVTLVTTFAVGTASFQHAVAEHYRGSAVSGLADDVLTAVVTVVLVLTAFLAVTAGVALGNAVSFGAWLRRRDTALLRILGQSRRLTRATILAQSLLLAVTATVIGLALGTLYGWLGAQSVFGAEASGHFVVPVLPLPLLLGAAVAIAVLTVAASFAPVRSALRRPPIRAYLAQ